MITHTGDWLACISLRYKYKHLQIQHKYNTNIMKIKHNDKNTTKTTHKFDRTSYEQNRAHCPIDATEN